MKKFILFVFSLIIGLAVFCGIQTKATGITLEMEDGASVRTDDPAGIRFLAEVNSLEGSAEHGFYLAAGEHTLSAMETAIEANASLVGGNKLVKVPATGEDTSFAVTIYGMDELSEYLQDITAVAYVKVGDDYTFDKAVTRNIMEVSFEAVSNGYTGSILTTVTAAAKANYMVKSGSLNIFNEYTITELQTVKYGYSNLSALYTEFLSDYNAAIPGAALTASSSASDFYNSMRVGISDTAVRNLSSSNAAKFFDGANFTKWSWILNYFSTYGANVHVKNQANGLLRADRTCQSYDGYRLVHLASSIYNLFKEAHEVNSYSANDFTSGESAYSNVTWPAVTNFNDVNVVRVGDSITLPDALAKDAYVFTEYNDGTTGYAALGSYTITSTVTTLKPVFTPQAYSITYHLDGGTNNVGNPATYTIETNDISLLPATKAEKVFSGWFDNEGLTGSAVASIPKGSTGNLDLYAKWTDPAPEPLGVTSADVRVLNEITPDIIVKAGLTGKYYLSGTDLDDDYASLYYTLNSKAFTTVSAALSAASANDIIYVFAGTYSEAITIDKAGIKIIGPNYNINGYGSRNTEAVITGMLSITAANVNINGLKFDSSGNIYTTATATTIEYIYSTSTPSNFISGYESRYAQIGGKESGSIIIRNSWLNTQVGASEYRNAIVLAGDLKDTLICDNKISNTATACKSLEAIMIYNVVDTLTIKNNTIDAVTSGYSIRVYSCYYSSSKYASRIDIVNNIITAESDTMHTAKIQVRRLGYYAATTLNIVGNEFEHLTGDTFNFEESNANSTINIKYNYFKSSYKLSTPGSSTIAYTDNFYEVAQTTATSDVSAIANKAALVTAYKASADFASYGSVCVYED